MEARGAGGEGGRLERVDGFILGRRIGSSELEIR
jgi:hypothetical protein